MITEKQKKWIMDIKSGKTSKEENPQKYSVYKKRIRERIDREIKNLKWLAENAPEFLVDLEYELDKYGYVKHQRILDLMLVIKTLLPELEPILIRKTDENGMEHLFLPIGKRTART